MQIQQKQVRSQTEAQIAALSREIIGVYDAARKSILEDLGKVYVQILSGVAPEDYYNTIIKYNRLNKLLTEVNKQYLAYSVKAGSMTVESSRVAMTNAYYKNQFVESWFTPNVGINLNFTPIPAALVELSVTGNLVNWQSIGTKAQARIEKTFGTINPYVPKEGTMLSILTENRKKEALKISRTISSGLLQGKSYNQTATDIKGIIGKRTSEGFTGAKANALRIVRTESNRTYNAGSFANSQAVSKQGVRMMRIWVAVHDLNTRDRHQALDGQKVEVDKPFHSAGAETMFPGGFGIASQDIHCRCSTIDAVNGIPPSTRLGRNADGEYEVFDWQNYPEWEKKNGLKQLKSGNIV